MLSILIVNWNTRDLLRACLNSIYRFPPASPYEIIVVDNASSDGSAEMVREEFPSLLLISPQTNTGYAKGNNLAFSRASGEYLLTLNPDTEFVDDSLSIAFAQLDAQSSFGCLACKLVSPDGTTQPSVRGFPSLLGILGDVTGLGRAFRGSRFDSYRLSSFDYDVAGKAEQPMGTFLLFRREALGAVGDPSSPFDESFPIFFNEVDLLLRLNNAGWPCWYSPLAKVVHHGGMSTRQVRKGMIWESHRSLVRFLWKHTQSVSERLLLPLVALGIYVAAFVRARGFHAGFRPDH
jgi:GT2 family glycosyltransferase